MSALDDIADRLSAAAAVCSATTWPTPHRLLPRFVAYLDADRRAHGDVAAAVAWATDADDRPAGSGRAAADDRSSAGSPATWPASTHAPRSRRSG